METTQAGPLAAARKAAEERRAKGQGRQPKAKPEPASDAGDGQRGTTPDGRPFTSRHVNLDATLFFPRDIPLPTRLGLRVWLMGFNRETGQSVIRTERKPKNGGNRLNTERYRQHIAKCEQFGTEALARGLKRLETDRESSKAGDATPGVAGGVSFLDLLADAIEREEQRRTELEQQQQRHQSQSQQQPEPKPATVESADADAPEGSDASTSSDSTSSKAEAGNDGGQGSGSAQNIGVGGAEHGSGDEYPVEAPVKFLTQAVQKAIKQRWPISDDMRSAVVAGLTKLMVQELGSDKPNARTLLGVCKTVGMLERQNQTDELRLTPQLHLHGGKILTNEQQQPERTIQPADSRASIARAVVAELRKRQLIIDSTAGGKSAEQPATGTDGGDAGATGPSGGGTDTGGGAAGGVANG